MTYSTEEILNELNRRSYEGGWIKRFFREENTRELYSQHWKFFDAGAEFKQRLFRAANRSGKTTAMGSEVVMHMTGIYHPDWKGKRFDGSTIWWIGGKTSETVRQILQPLLLGPVGDLGTGLIPRELLDLESLTDAKKSGTGILSFRVKHVSGGYSQAEFKSYDQGRQSWEGTERSVWLDEEPPLDVYVEALTRTMTGNNILAITFTPLKGASEVVLSFSRDGSFDEGAVGPGKHVTTCTWDDVPHLSEQEKQDLLASLPPYQRDARSKGIPSLGSGVIWPVPESEFLVEPFEIPNSWPRHYGMDVGSKTAAVWFATDLDTRQVYVYSTYYQERQEPSIHAAAIRGRGEWIPGVIDPASRGRSQIDGQQLMQMYFDLGLLITPAINAVETGLYSVWEALSTGILKVFNRGCEPLLKEMRTYSRDEKGHVIKLNDHCCDSLRYGYMTRDVAKTKLSTKKDANNGLSSPNYTWV